MLSFDPASRNLLACCAPSSCGYKEVDLSHDSITRRHRVHASHSYGHGPTKVVDTGVTHAGQSPSKRTDRPRSIAGGRPILRETDEHQPAQWPPRSDAPRKSGAVGRLAPAALQLVPSIPRR
jgi:hypothetical protein